jgi:hypothetical protein
MQPDVQIKQVKIEAVKSSLAKDFILLDKNIKVGKAITKR